MRIATRNFGNLEIQVRASSEEETADQWIRMVLDDPENGNPNRVISGIGAGDWRDHLIDMDSEEVAAVLFGKPSVFKMNKEPLLFPDRPLEELDGMPDAAGIPRSSEEWGEARARRERENIDPRKSFIESVWIPAIDQLREEIRAEREADVSSPGY